MPTVARNSDSKFTPCPEGLHQAVCVDVVDVGMMTTMYGTRPKARIVWQTEEIDPATGRRYEVRALYTLSLSEKATLRKHLEAWRGKKFTLDELRGFDLDKLIGVNCQIQIIHNLGSEGRTFANVQAIVPLHPKAPKIAPLDYVRETPPVPAAAPGQAPPPAPPPPELDEIPF